MSQEAIHISIATKNEEFFESFDLTTSVFLEWAVSGLFYSLIHYIDACLASKLNCHPTVHGTRTTLVKTESYLQGIYDDYRFLKDQSEAGRYYGQNFTPDEVRILNHTHFQPAKVHLQSLLS